MLKLFITEESNDQRADRYLHKLLDVPKAVVQKWFRTKKVRKNGRHIQASDRVYTKDEIVLYAQADFRKKALPDQKGDRYEPEIVYENKDLLILYKPPGQLSHAAHGQEYGKNLVDGMIRRLMRTCEYVPRMNESFTPAIVNRLDRNTGGLIIGAKNYESLKVLNEAMRNNEIEKYYKALTYGKALAPGKYENYLTKNEAQLTSRITEDGKYVRLDILDAKNYGHFTLHTMQLHTGRTHQIRAQMQALGTPVAGDPKYGNARINKQLQQKGFCHQYLLADALTFRSHHPLLLPLLDQTIQLEPKPVYQNMLNIARSLP